MVRFKPLRKLIRTTKTLYYIAAFKNVTTSQINAIRNRPDSPFRKPCRAGYMRGIDFYSEPDLIRILTLYMAKYRKVHGVLPDLTNPRGFNEKILWMKFFGDIKIPESGNKLLTSTFIPDDLQGLVNCPPILWRSAEPRLPRNHEIKPGACYIKATHGSGLFKRVRYPLDEKAVTALERKCAKWLRTPYGIEKGEWWYNVFDRELIIDEDMADDDRSIAWNFFVFRGKVEHIMLHRKGDAKKGELDELTHLDADFRPLPTSQQSFRPPVRDFGLPDDVKDRMKHCAARIGADAPFVRVDFVVGKDGGIYLIELTFSPANGLAQRPPELDSWLGEKWIL
jgi:hypothetical protein